MAPVSGCPLQPVCSALSDPFSPHCVSSSLVFAVVGAVAVASSEAAPGHLLAPVWSPYSGSGGPEFAPPSAGFG